MLALRCLLLQDKLLGANAAGGLRQQRMKKPFPLLIEEPFVFFS